MVNTPQTSGDNSTTGPEAPEPNAETQAPPVPRVSKPIEPVTPDFGTNSKQRWDEPKNHPSKRLSIAEDPTGQKNLKRLDGK